MHGIQHGFNENMNGVLWQSCSRAAAASLTKELDDIAAKLNNRPRKSLSWMLDAFEFRQH